MVPQIVITTGITFGLRNEKVPAKMVPRDRLLGTHVDRLRPTWTPIVKSTINVKKVRNEKERVKITYLPLKNICVIIFYVIFFSDILKN